MGTENILIFLMAWAVRWMTDSTVHVGRARRRRRHGLIPRRSGNVIQPSLLRVGLKLGMWERWHGGGFRTSMRRSLCYSGVKRSQSLNFFLRSASPLQCTCYRDHLNLASILIQYNAYIKRSRSMQLSQSLMSNNSQDQFIIYISLM